MTKEISNGMLTFTKEGCGKVRVLKRENGLWFVATDLLWVAGASNINDMLVPLSVYEQGLYIRDTYMGEQTLQTVTESGLYSILARSPNPAAIVFKEWIVTGVIPAIRSNKQPSTQTVPTLSTTELFQRVGKYMYMYAFEQKMMDLGLLDVKVHSVDDRVLRGFYVLTEQGQQFGDNFVNPHYPDETQPHYYTDKFSSLLQYLLGNTGNTIQGE